MNKRLLTICILLLPFLGIAQQQVSIIPQPVSFFVQDGHFTVDKNTSIIFNTKENNLLHAATFFNAFIKNEKENKQGMSTGLNILRLLTMKKLVQ